MNKRKRVIDFHSLKGWPKEPAFFYLVIGDQESPFTPFGVGSAYDVQEQKRTYLVARHCQSPRGDR